MIEVGVMPVPIAMPVAIMLRKRVVFQERLAICCRRIPRA
jgi:hypothetical protein